MQQNFLRLEASGLRAGDDLPAQSPTSAPAPSSKICFSHAADVPQRKLAYNFNEFRKIAAALPVFARPRVNLGRTDPAPARASNASSFNKDLIF
jgi:hypothetical protein